MIISVLSPSKGDSAAHVTRLVGINVFRDKDRTLKFIYVFPHSELTPHTMLTQDCMHSLHKVAE